MGIKIILSVAIGGALGAVIRYLIATIVGTFTNLKSIVVSTIMVNMIGSFFIGLLWGIFDNREIDHLPELRHFLMIGGLGSMTTFSTFSLENFILIRNGAIKEAALYILASNILCIILTFLGYYVSQKIIYTLQG